MNKIYYLRIPTDIISKEGFISHAINTYPEKMCIGTLNDNDSFIIQATKEFELHEEIKSIVAGSYEISEENIPEGRYNIIGQAELWPVK